VDSWRAACKTSDLRLDLSPCRLPPHVHRARAACVGLEGRAAAVHRGV